MLERAVARARTVFEEQRIACALAKTEDRRRVQHKGKAFLDLGDLGLDIGGDLLGAAVALVEGLQDRKGNGIIRRIGLLCGVETGQSDHVGNTIRAERDVHHPLQHGIGALQRGTLGQLHAGDQIELVLGRNEATRHRVEHQPGAGQQHDIDHEYHTASAKRARNGALIAVRARLEEAVERPEEPAEQAFDQARKHILRRIVRMQQFGGERRRQGQRIDRRDHGRDRDRHCELLVEGAGDAGQERHRHEHRAQHERDRDNRPGYFGHRLVRGLKRCAAFLDVTLDILDHDDRVIDHDADREHQAEQRERVNGKAEQIEHGEGADDRYRNGDQWNDRGAPGLQEQDHHQHDQRDRLEQRVNDGRDRFSHEDRGIIIRAVAHTGRELPGELVHLCDHSVPGRQRVGAGRLERADDGRVVMV